MAKLENIVQHALQKTRVLVLASQVFLGFEFRAFFEPRYEQLPEPLRRLKLLTLALTLALFGVLNLYFVTNAALGSPALAGWVGAATGSLAVAGFFGIGHLGRRNGAKRSAPEREEGGGPNIEKKISHVLTETRVIIPGAQVLLGLQFTIVLGESFERLAEGLKWVHAASMALTSLAIILLIVPAAYHRIAEGGDETERLHRLGTGFVVAALAPLALAVSLETYVVLHKALGSNPVAWVAAAATFVTMGVLWYAVPLLARQRRAS